MFKVGKLLALSSVASAMDLSDEDRQLICDATTNPFPPHRQAAIRWLPFPKTKTSFASTVWHYGCNIDPEVSIDDFEKRFDFQLNETYPLQDWCPKLVDHSPGDHMPIGEKEWACHSGHFVTMVREPSERVMAAFKSHTADWSHQCILDCNPENSNTHFECDVVNDRLRQSSTTCDVLHRARCPADYAKALPGQGCQTKMILGYPCSADISLTQRDIEEAVARINSGFSFVGVMEEYELSLCLFHRILGGDMLAAETVEFTHGSSDSPELSEDCDDKVIVDEMDLPVYNAAKDFFERKVRQTLRELKGDADFHSGPDPDQDNERPAACQQIRLDG